MTPRHLLPALAGLGLSLTLLPGPSAAQASADAQGLLRDGQQRALYTFAKDSGGQSLCTDGCAAAWPPLLAATGAQPTGALTLHPRGDGSLQWGWRGKPLYRFAADRAGGEAGGDGQGGVWHAVRVAAAPAAAANTAPAAPAPAATGGYRY